MPDSAANVAAYHRQLSAHLSTLLRSTGSTKPPTSSRQGTARPSRPGRNTSSQSTHSNSTNETTSPQPLHASQPPALVGTSSRTQSTETAHLATPPEKTASNQDRQEEQMNAWKEAGPKIFTPLPLDFNLVLKKSSKAKEPSTQSHVQPSTVGTGVTKDGIKGLGIDLHISHTQDLAIKMGLISDDPLVSYSRPQPPRHAQQRLTVKPSLESLGNTISTSVSPRYPAESVIIAGPSHPCPKAGVQRRRQSQETSQAKREQVGLMALRNPLEEEKPEEYEHRTALRMKKRQAELNGKISRWRDAVQLVNIEIPEIEPTPPTPSIASGMLRLSPLSSTVRPTCLPAVPPDHQSANFTDFARRLRSIDALLGDMSLIHPKATGVSDLTLPIRIRTDTYKGSNPDPPPPARILVSEGMPTPKPTRNGPIFAPALA